MGYFSENNGLIGFDQFNNQTSEGLRECQQGGFWAVRSHLTAYPEEPALISMPTGSGKTALMMMISFALSEKQVLVVTASDILRNQTAEKFRELDGLKDADILEDEIETPSVKIINNRVTDEEQWDEIDEDVVVALPQNISSVYNTRQYDREIVDPPIDKFDLVFFDEAHRSRAPSWMNLLNTFQSAKQILLTATPFRQDRQSLPGRLVYHYPLSNAIEEGLYQPLSLDSISAREEDEPDQVFAARAKKRIQEMRNSFDDAKMLVRCGGIKEAKSLERIYQSEGLEVKAIHSDRTSKQNSKRLKKLREGDIDGVIAVGMLGEGIDITNLKLAVLHEPPKSFAFTLQLLGRVTRPTEDGEVQAQVIADPVDLAKSGVEDEVKKLYHEDEGWKDLVPEIASDYTESHSPVSVGSSRRVLRGVDEGDLEPYLSTRLYDVTPDQFGPLNTIDLGDDVVAYKLPRTDDDFVGLITQRKQRPTWGKKTPLYHRQYDLHLFYYHEDTRTLFEATSSPGSLADEIREILLEGDADLYGGESLVRVIQGDEDIEYQVAGLANALGSSGSLPTYKMLLGDRVEGAVRQTDAKAFTHGHAVAEVDGETVGISNDQGRVWSSGRRKVDQFIDWCNDIGDKLERFEDVTTPPRLGLGEITRIRSFPESVIFGTLNPKLRRIDVEIDTQTVASSGVRQEIKELALTSLQCSGTDSGVVQFEFIPQEGAVALSGEYDVSSNEVRGEITKCQFIIDEEGERSELPGDSFFDKYKPYFYTGDGSLVSNGRGHRIRHELSDVPDECFIDESRIDWEECATWNEYDITKNGNSTEPERRIDVHGWVEEYIEDNGESGQIVFCDHTQGEIADYVQIEHSDRRITFYHCKARNKGKNSGARLESVREVVDQVHRSISWIKYSGLPEQILYRLENTEYPHFISGKDKFEEFQVDFLPMEWDFTVCVVQPGLDHENARSSENLNTVLLTCKEWLEGVDADFRIIGDPNNQVLSLDG
ncbi:DEAD/DEAH box helicase family protein [Haladaptatus sp. AB643]|uniref:DEAD/DEAH box helicase n=1 Tax=Haladaptatus sp. AB643 TaxID=2934174 RepID=UPI00209C6365|nr:DEAD/DEAH box helicase family protein [Haladaptatus sp. AB643]MCO8245349.1 DEAD/DEAH box helicase family protein [Haladaptatus sp. AB643]